MVDRVLHGANLHDAMLREELRSKSLPMFVRHAKSAARWLIEARDVQRADKHVAH